MHTDPGDIIEVVVTVACQCILRIIEDGPRAAVVGVVVILGTRYSGPAPQKGAVPWWM